MTCRCLHAWILLVGLILSSYLIYGQNQAYVRNVQSPADVGSAAPSSIPVPGQTDPGLVLSRAMVRPGPARSGKSFMPLTVANGNPIFQSESPYSSGGPYAVSVAVADVNGDGKLDLLVTNKFAGVGVLLGNGDGTFQLAQTYASGVYAALSVAVADVNTDGKPDLLVGSHCYSLSDCSTGGVGVLLGNGDGSFQAARAYGSGGANAYAVAVADVNNDGKPDLLVSNRYQSSNPNNSSVGVLLGNGDGTFQAAQEYGSAGYIGLWVAVADVNGDGKPDLLVANQYQSNNFNNGSVGVLLGNGDGSFQPALEYASGGYNAFSVAVADANKDGKPDLLVTNECEDSGNCNNGGIGVLLGNGDGSFQPAHTYASGGYNAYSVAVADVNGDSTPDLLVANEYESSSNTNNGGVGVLLGNGDGIFQPAQAYASLGTHALSVAVADVNGDGQSDVLVANEYQGDNFAVGSVGVLLGKGDGSFQAVQTYASGGQFANSVAAADVNGDGKLDLLVSNEYQSNGSNSNGVIGVMLGRSDGTFQAVQAYGSGGQFPKLVTVADVNGDSKPDLLVANELESSSNANNGGVGVLLGNGDGSFQDALTFASGGAFAISIAVADVNGDGKPDLLIANECQNNADCSNGTIGVLLGNGDGSFQPAQAYASGGYFLVSVAAADVNGDGKPDLLIVNDCQSRSDCNGEIGVLLGNGDGTFQSVQTYASGGYGAISVTVADVNGDAKQDLLVAHACQSSSDCTYGGVAVLLGNGDGTFQAGQIYASGGNSAFAVTVADVSGDGRPDLVVANGDYTAVLSGNGDGTFQLPTVYSPGAIQLVTGDFNLDGKPDVALAAALNDVTVLLNTSSGFGQGTKTTVASSQNPSGFSQALTFTATVTPNGSGNPTGTVSFYDSSALLGTASLSNGTAQYSTAVLSVGPHSITATYNGDSKNQGSSSTALSQVVSQAGTTLAVVSSVNPSSFNQMVAFTATITPQYGGQATGTVSFMDGATQIGSITVTNDAAVLIVSSFAVGNHPITALYLGDSNFMGATSGVLSQNVNAATSTTTLSSSANPSTPGQSITLTAVVSGQYGGTPTGTATFFSNGSPIGTATLSGGQASVAVALKKEGTYLVTATYSGDGNFLTGTSPVFNQIVGRATTTTTVTSSLNPSVFGQAVTFTATVGSVIGNPPDGEMLTFAEGSVTLGTAALSGGIATFTTSGLATGPHNVTAAYAGDSKLAPSTSAKLNQSVSKATTSTAIVSSQNPSIFGQAVTFTVTVTGQYGGAVTGSVTFKDRNTTLGTVNIAAGQASLTTSTLSKGSHSIVANYTPDVNNQKSSGSLSQAVN